MGYFRVSISGNVLHDIMISKQLSALSSGRFAGSKKPRSREMSACNYALHSVCPQLSFFSFLSLFPSLIISFLISAVPFMVFALGGELQLG